MTTNLWKTDVTGNPWSSRAVRRLTARIDQLSIKNDRLRALLKAQNERLRALLNDETYIKCKADYLRGHLSHAGFLESKEREALGQKEAG